MVPPTSASVPSGLPTWAMSRIGPSTFASAASDAGSSSRTRLNTATEPSSLCPAREDCATPSASPSASAYAFSSGSSRDEPSVDRSSTEVGSAAPLGWPFWNRSSATADSASPDVPLSEKSNVGLKPNAKMLSTRSTPPEATA